MVSSVGDDPDQILSMFKRDVNNASPTRDQTQGLFGLPFHVNQTWGRFSARNVVLDTLNAKKANGSPKHRLTLKVHSLVSRVLFETKPGKKPKAIGVEYLEGQSVYSADPRHNPANKGTLRQAKARREVILAAGVFNTPQILQLSGVGPAAELSQHNITLVANLPGVGKHLQDNPELPVVGLANEPYVSIPEPGEPVCTFGFPPDPCVDAFRQGQGPYTRAGANAHAFMLKTNHTTNGERDIFMFGIGNFAFRGYWPLDATSNIPFDLPGTFGLSMVKMNPQSRAGTVKLRSADPRDTPLINFKVFSDGADTDLDAMADVASWARRAFGNVAAPLGPIRPTEPPCSSSTPADCRPSDKQWIKDQAFGHHGVGTCAIGRNNDPDAVLDSKFRVRGVTGLRVVDGSAFPRVPGAFPVISTFLLGEKASDDILDDA
jgi:choline dehydrogenase